MTALNDIVKEISERSILHVGCGKSPLPDWLTGKETRLDIDKENTPDIVANMTDLGKIGPFDVIYSAHCLEHISLAEIKIALKEFLRVLAYGGIAFLFVPDVEGLTATEETLFTSEVGPISGLDILYGHQAAIQDNAYMEHKYGFMKATFEKLLLEAGFCNVQVNRLPCYNLIGVGTK